MRHPWCWGISGIFGSPSRLCTDHAGRLLSLFLSACIVSATAFAQASTESGAPEDTMEEIVVTARKVEENLQDIPMSVQVLTADLLQELNVTSFYELQFNIPGLVVNNVGMFGAGFALRGVTDQGGTSLSVATHLNGVYLGRSNLALARLFDLERIEVLKGPQGTLYGRNATGGSINFITQAPLEEWGAEVEAAYGSYHTARVQGHFNLPFNKAAFRLAFIGSEGDGYIRNAVDDRTFGENDFWGVRASLRIDATDKLIIDLMAQHVADDGATGELWSPPSQYLPDPDDIRLTSVTLDNPYLETTSDNVSLNVGYDLGFAALRSITGFAHNLVSDLDDCAGAPQFKGCIRGSDPDQYDQWSQELQLVSQPKDSVSWLLGLYYFHADRSLHFHTLIPLLSPLPITNRYSDSVETAYAAFGELRWRLSELWSLTGGLRLSHETNRESDIGTGTRDNHELTTAEGSWNSPSWRVGVEYTAASSSIIYASISTGFKSGAVSTVRLPTGQFDNFSPEDLIAYELGLNSQWLDRRLTLNGNAFYYDFRDLQILSTFIFDGELITDVENAAKARIYGLDVSGDYQLSDRLLWSFGTVWLPGREFVEFVSEWTGDNLSGNSVPRAPEWSTTTALSYRFMLRDSGHVSARLEYNYRSNYYFTKENNPLLAQNSFGLLNLYLGFEPDDSKWRIFAIGRNLTNADYYNQIFIQSSPGYPATWEAGINIRF